MNDYDGLMISMALFNTIVWEIFVQDILVVKFICCVVFLVSCTQQISYPQILFALNNFYMCTLFIIQKLPDV